MAIFLGPYRRDIAIYAFRQSHARTSYCFIEITLRNMTIKRYLSLIDITGYGDAICRRHHRGMRAPLFAPSSAAEFCFMAKCTM